jgi:hypothetical protein
MKSGWAGRGRARKGTAGKDQFIVWRKRFDFWAHFIKKELCADASSPDKIFAEMFIHQMPFDRTTSQIDPQHSSCPSVHVYPSYKVLSDKKATLNIQLELDLRFLWFHNFSLSIIPADMMTKFALL